LYFFINPEAPNRDLIGKKMNMVLRFLVGLSAIMMAVGLLIVLPPENDDIEVTLYLRPLAHLAPMLDKCASEMFAFANQLGSMRPERLEECAHTIEEVSLTIGGGRP
jgi:hypothetical protein